MQILLAVIDDLFQFARTAIFGVLHTNLDGGYFAQHVALEEKTASLFNEGENVAHKNDEQNIELIQGEQYFIGVSQVFLYVDPVVAFDTASAGLSYGQMVMVQKLGGRWAFVRTSEHEGWIFKDVLREQAKDVFPSFVQNAVYDAQNEETLKLRLCIDDMFLGGETSSVLADSEYVAYRFWKRGRKLPWTQERPRIAGTWQKKLRGKNGIHISITPKTESVMEFIVDDIGHLCFVEAVFPDESIKMSSIGLNTEGVFEEMMMGKEEWKELRPVFIHTL